MLGPPPPPPPPPALTFPGCPACFLLLLLLFQPNIDETNTLRTTIMHYTKMGTRGTSNPPKSKKEIDLGSLVEKVFQTNYKNIDFRSFPGGSHMQSVHAGAVQTHFFHLGPLPRNNQTTLQHLLFVWTSLGAQTRSNRTPGPLLECLKKTLPKTHHSLLPGERGWGKRVSFELHC